MTDFSRVPEFRNVTRDHSTWRIQTQIAEDAPGRPVIGGSPKKHFLGGIEDSTGLGGYVCN